MNEMILLASVLAMVFFFHSRARKFAQDVDVLKARVKTLENFREVHSKEIMGLMRANKKETPPDMGPFMKMAAMSMLPLIDAIEDTILKKQMQDTIDEFVPNQQKEEQRLIDHFLKLKSEHYPFMVSYHADFKHKNRRIEDIRQFFKNLRDECIAGEFFEKAKLVDQYIADQLS